jgi:hypothetical protein
MGPVITIRGIKITGFLEKNLERPPDQFLLVWRAFFDGGRGKTDVFWWYFCGEFVVDACLNVVRKMAVIRGRKFSTFCRFIFGVCSEISHDMAPGWPGFDDRVIADFSWRSPL